MIAITSEEEKSRFRAKNRYADEGNGTMKTMDRKFLFLAIAGIITTIVASLISIYAGGVVLILLAVI
ncbi:MAG: hypothetical protein CW742_11885, partial [Methanoregula sp.]